MPRNEEADATYLAFKALPSLLDVRLQTEGSRGLIPTYFLCYAKIGTEGLKKGASRR
jgi:hypothetical protein